MSEKSNKKKTLQPSWKYYFWQYLIGILTVPVLLGIFVLANAIRKKNKHFYLIGVETITAEDNNYSQKFDLVNLEDVKVEQDWIQKKLDVGLVRIYKEGSEMELHGIEAPHDFKVMLLTVSSNLKALQKKKSPKKKPAQKPSRQTSKMNYLTGLWQQGLLSDEDYHNERKHFDTEE